MFYQTKECIVIIILRKLLDLVTLFIHVFINIVIHHQNFCPYLDFQMQSVFVHLVDFVSAQQDLLFLWI